jgi:hypothetical protein
MAHYNYESRSKLLSRKFDTSDLRRERDVACDADDEEVADALIKN